MDGGTAGGNSAGISGTNGATVSSGASATGISCSVGGSSNSAAGSATGSGAVVNSGGSAMLATGGSTISPISSPTKARTSRSNVVSVSCSAAVNAAGATSGAGAVSCSAGNCADSGVGSVGSMTSTDSAAGTAAKPVPLAVRPARRSRQAHPPARGRRRRLLSGGLRHDRRQVGQRRQRNRMFLSFGNRRRFGRRLFVLSGPARRRSVVQPHPASALARRRVPRAQLDRRHSAAVGCSAEARHCRFLRRLDCRCGRRLRLQFERIQARRGGHVRRLGIARFGRSRLVGWCGLFHGAARQPR